MKQFVSALANLIRQLLASPAAMLRTLLLVVIWGACAFGWGTLGDYAVQKRIPAVLGSTERLAQEIDTYLADRLALLDSLAADPRIPQSLAEAEGFEHQDIRRALYEFSYINRLPQVYLWHGATSQLAMPATADDPDEDVRTWLAGLAGQTRSLFVSNLNKKPAAYLALRVEAVKDGSAYAVLRQSWPYLLTNMPGTATVPEFDGSAYGLSTVLYGKPWWAGSSADQTAKPIEIPTKLIDAERDYMTLPDGSVIVTAKLLRFENWAASAMLPGAAAVGDTMRMVQWGLLVVALFASLGVLWRPTLPWRQRTFAFAQPMLAKLPSFAALGPLLAKAQAISRGEKSEGGAPLAAPGSFSKDDFADPKRAKAMGGAAFKPKPAAPKKNVSLQDLAPGEAKPDATAAEAPPVADVIAAVAPPSKTGANSSIAQMIETCINTDRTRLLYQPVYRANDGVPIMHEVYLRLLDEEGREISPATFFPVAEKLGWTPKLDAHVFQRLMQLHFGGGNTPRTPLAINLSGTTLESLGYLEMLMNMSNSPVLQNLVFEVRSQELMRDPHALRFLHECQEMGVKLTVDYFGGGPAMVETIKRLGFDYVKMDAMRFGKSDLTKKELINLCRSAQRVGLPVILEKVENVTMEVFARRAAIPFLQGYLFAKPVDKLAEGSMAGWRSVAQDEKNAATAAAAPAQPAPTAAPDAAPAAAQPPAA